MNVKHVVPTAESMRIDDIKPLIDAMFGVSDHEGIAPFRVGLVATGLFDTAFPVMFSKPMPDDTYQVFLQPNSSVSATYWATALTVNGFTLNVSVAVSALFSYAAIGIP